MVKITKDKGMTLNDRSCKDKYIAACEVNNIKEECTRVKIKLFQKLRTHYEFRDPQHHLQHAQRLVVLN
jgi:hypothetical protein